MNPLLEVAGLTYYHPDASAPCICDISFTLDSGEFLIVAGPSGGGKTTFIKCINGVYPHLSEGKVEGRVIFDGQEIMALSPEERSTNIGTVFQDFESQITQVTVEDELAFGPENLALPREEIIARVKRVAEGIGLNPADDPNALSGGNKQRLCIGGALSMRPRLLLLDEPLSNLDSDGVNMLMQFIGNLRCQGTAVLMVEHRLELIRHLADRILFVEKGRLTSQPKRENVLGGSWPFRRGTAYPREAVGFTGLGFAYHKGTPILDGVECKIMEGEMAVILGKNGSGKSTLLRIICGIERIRTGEGRLLGTSINRKRANFFRGKVGLVMQNPNHQLCMETAYEEILSNCMNPEIADELLAIFKLTEMKNRHPYSLSEGEKRRLAVAAVLASRPSVLLLDEPTLGQDRESLELMVCALREQNAKRGTTIITVTHDREAAIALGQRRFVLSNGSLSELREDKAMQDYFSGRYPKPTPVRLPSPEQARGAS